MSGAPDGDSLLNNVAYSLKNLANFANLPTLSPTDVAHGHALRSMQQLVRAAVHPQEDGYMGVVAKG